jgi:hypothetical protein
MNSFKALVLGGFSLLAEEDLQFTELTPMTSDVTPMPRDFKFQDHPVSNVQIVLPWVERVVLRGSPRIVSQDSPESLYRHQLPISCGVRLVLRRDVFWVTVRI